YLAIATSSCSTAAPIGTAAPGETTSSPPGEETEAPGPSAGDENEVLSSAVVTDIRFSCGELSLPYDPGLSTLEVTSLAAGRPFTMTIVGTPGGSAWVEGTLVPMNAPYSMVVPVLGPAHEIHIAYRNLAGQITSQSIRTLPTDFP